MPKQIDDPETTKQLNEFADQLCEQLQLDRNYIDRMIPQVLHTVGIVAHGTARPAGAVSAFLAGLAIGRQLKAEKLPSCPDDEHSQEILELINQQVEGEK